MSATPATLRYDASAGSGDTLRPCAVMIRFFLRPMIVMKPSASISARSPVHSQPSASVWQALGSLPL
jgi:hypothetical protein